MAEYVVDSIVNRTLAGHYDQSTSIWLDFEAQWPHRHVRNWFRENRHLSIYLGLVYITATLIGQKLMEKRQKFELRPLLLIWNVIMAVFSGFLAIRVGPFITKRFFTLTVYGAICDGKTEEALPIIAWLDIFVITKAVEFIDTLFIILRKQHLAFIHWYHHATVVIVCWYAEGSIRGPPNSLHYVAMNSFVHAFMYTYYALKVLRLPVPRFVNIALTSLQIAQMFAAILMNAAAVYFMFLRSDRPCDDDPKQIIVASSVYMSYFFLFCQFFYNTYIRRNSARLAPSPTTTTSQKSKSSAVETAAKKNGAIKHD